MKSRLALGLILTITAGTSYGQYRPAGDKIKTEWAEQINPENVWNAYPRPLLERREWQNLNGLWEYAIVDSKLNSPAEYDGEILVPFPVESSLSGVGRNVGADKNTWYKRSFSIPSSWKGKDVILNFGAVDWKCDVWINDTKVGSHTGGYTPFSMNITNALNRKGDNTLTVRVYDPTDRGYQPRGKQVSRPGGIWYTPVTGIWQTVWIEPVNRTHIQSIKTIPDIDRNTVTVTVVPSRHDTDLISTVEITENGNTIASGKSINGQPIELAMPESIKLSIPQKATQQCENSPLSVTRTDMSECN